MARHNVWFGTREYMTWVPAPAADNPTYERANWQASGQYLNGGAYSVRSSAGAMKISLSWNPMPRQDADLLRAFFDGAYGPGPFYYADPFGGENILPQWLSMPYMNYNDNNPGFRKNGVLSLETATSGTQGYPTQRSRYYYSSSATNVTFDIPVPPNNVFSLGVRGELDSAPSGPNGTVRVNNAIIPPLSTNDGLRYSSTGEVNGGANGSWATLSLAQTSGQIPVLQGLMARYVGSEASPGTQLYGRFVPGRGFGALQLEGSPQITRYSSQLNREGITANFVEVGPWQV